MTQPSDIDRPIPNSYWVRQGSFVAGEYPGDVFRSTAADKLNGLLAAGVSRFIDLTEEGELKPYTEAAQAEADRLGASFAWERHPVVDTSTPSHEHMVEILDAIDSAMARGETVYVHCMGGIGRTGTVVGCWLRRRGLTGEEALAQIAEWWQGVAKRRRRPRSPENDTQRRYILDWAE